MLSPFFNKRKAPTIGLALSGGAAHGMAHIGALKAFEEHQFKPDMLSGASAGALVGILYAAGVPLQKIDSIASKIRWKDMITLRPGNHWIYTTEKVPKLLRSIIGNPDWTDLNIPFFPISFDYSTGKTICPRDLSPIEAVHASLSVPIVFKPFPYRDTALGDGGMTEIVPTKFLKEQGADRIIGVNVITGGMLPYSQISGFMPLFGQLKQILIGHAYRPFQEMEDVYIVPDVNKYSVANLKPYHYYVEQGYIAAKEAMPQIKALRSKDAKDRKK